MARQGVGRGEGGYSSADSRIPLLRYSISISLEDFSTLPYSTLYFTLLYILSIHFALATAFPFITYLSTLHILWLAPSQHILSARKLNPPSLHHSHSLHTVVPQHHNITLRASTYNIHAPLSVSYQILRSKTRFVFVVDGVDAPPGDLPRPQ